MRLSQNLTLREMTYSQKAKEHNINNSVKDPEVLENLKAVARKVFQPIRDHYKVPITPNSGYRSLALNRLLGSRDTSQHVIGEAIDIEVPGISNYDLACWIKNNLEFDQLILEAYIPGVYNSGWVHVSYKRNRENRKEVLTWIPGKGYFDGLRK